MYPLIKHLYNSISKRYLRYLLQKYLVSRNKILFKSTLPISGDRALKSKVEQENDKMNNNFIPAILFSSCQFISGGVMLMLFAYENFVKENDL